MSSNSRTQTLAMIATAAAAVLFASLWMQWSTAGFDESAGFLSSIKVKSTGWEIHDYLDIVIAVAAGLALISNGSIAVSGGSGLAGASSLFGGVVAGGAVAWTMINPPIPPELERFNDISFLPDIQFDPAYGMFIALAMAVALILLGVLQMTSGSSPNGSGAPPAPSSPSQLRPQTPPPPDPFAKTPPPPDPFSKGPGSAPPPAP